MEFCLNSTLRSLFLHNLFTISQLYCCKLAEKQYSVFSYNFEQLHNWEYRLILLTPYDFHYVSFAYFENCQQSLAKTHINIA